jgi:hypothetical protein
MINDYKRNSTTTLFAALNVTNGSFFGLWYWLGAYCLSQAIAIQR